MRYLFSYSFSDVSYAFAHTNVTKMFFLLIFSLSLEPSIWGSIRLLNFLFSFTQPVFSLLQSLSIYKHNLQKKLIEVSIHLLINCGIGYFTTCRYLWVDYCALYQHYVSKTTVSCPFVLYWWLVKAISLLSNEAILFEVLACNFSFTSGRFGLVISLVQFQYKQ